MQKLYEEFFHIPRGGRIREKVMVVQVTLTTLVMIICLVAMAFGAYAHFSYAITSGVSVLKGANFQATVSISCVTASGQKPVDVLRTDGNTCSAALKGGEIYTVTLTPGGTAETGFCRLTAKDCPEVFYTQQLGTDVVAGGKTEKIVFSLQVTADTTVQFQSHWGTSSHYDAYRKKGENAPFYITNAPAGDNIVRMDIRPPAVSEGKLSTTTTAATEATRLEQASVTVPPTESTTTVSVTETATTTTTTAATVIGSTAETETTATATSAASDSATTPGTTASGAGMATSTDSETNGTGEDTTTTPTTGET